MLGPSLLPLISSLRAFRAEARSLAWQMTRSGRQVGVGSIIAGCNLWQINIAIENHDFNRWIHYYKWANFWSSSIGMWVIRRLCDIENSVSKNDIFLTPDNQIWLVVWLPFFIFPYIKAISSSQLTFIFFRGVAQPPTRDVFFIQFSGIFAVEMFTHNPPWNDQRIHAGSSLSILALAWNERAV